MSNYEERHPQPTKNQLSWDHPIRQIMRDVCNLPDHPYNPDNPELMLIEYDELLAILERHVSSVSRPNSPHPGEIDGRSRWRIL